MTEDERKAALPPDYIALIDVREPPTYHNFEKEMARLCSLGILRVGEVSNLSIAHDDWCGIYRQKRCDCNPDILDRTTGRVINDSHSG